MNIENLKEGQVVKNYKELCELIDESPKGGDSKKSQLKELERYIKYHKEGNKFVIEEIYEEPLEKIDNRGKQDNNSAKYIEDIELNLIGEILTKGCDGKYVVGNGVLLKDLGLININYSYCKRRQDKLAIYLDINKTIVNEYYTNVDSMITGNLEKALRNLADRKILSWSQTKIICRNVITNITYSHTTRIDEFDEEIETIKPVVESDVIYTEVTEEEDRLITKCEKEVLDNMGYDSLTTVFLKNKLKEYYSNCHKLIRNKIPDLNFYFKAYKMIYTFEIVANELERLGYEDWEKRDNEINKEFINYGVIERIIDNAKKRRERELEKSKNGMGIKNTKYKYRTEEKYVKDYIEINNNVIDINKSNIKNEVKKAKKKS